MHLEQVHFERVFDAQQMNGVFSFEGGGQVRYGVWLPGDAVPASGKRLVLAFGEAGNWSTVLGWIDPATGALGLRRTWSMAADWLRALGAVSKLILLTAGAMLGLRYVVPLVALGVCGIGWLLWRAMRRNRVVRQALLEFPV